MPRARGVRSLHAFAQSKRKREENIIFTLGSASSEVSHAPLPCSVCEVQPLQVTDPLIRSSADVGL